jgi:hypothetical protein
MASRSCVASGSRGRALGRRYEPLALKNMARALEVPSRRPAQHASICPRWLKGLLYPRVSRFSRGHNSSPGTWSVPCRPPGSDLERGARCRRVCRRPHIDTQCDVCLSLEFGAWLNSPSGAFHRRAVLFAARRVLCWWIVCSRYRQDRRCLMVSARWMSA